jgi:hypothetical protein
METRGPLEGANKEGSRNRMVKGHMKYLPFVGHLIWRKECGGGPGPCNNNIYTGMEVEV